MGRQDTNVHSETGHMTTTIMEHMRRLEWMAILGKAVAPVCSVWVMYAFTVYQGKHHGKIQTMSVSK